MTLNQISYNSLSLSNLGAELVFTQSAEGKYHSFHWQSDLIILEHHNLSGDLCSFPLQPQHQETYLQIIQRVLIRKIPEQCHCLFEYQNQTLLFQLIISPILLPDGDAKLVLVTGYHLETDLLVSDSISSLPTNPDPYQKLLTNIARQIRLTLNLEVIWHQTVSSMGKELKVDQCLLLIPTNETNYLEVKAEYSQNGGYSLLGHRLNIQNFLEITKTILSRQPQLILHQQHSFFKARSILLVPTFYQQEFNGLICLSQWEKIRHWNQAELELVQELAEQVGIAMAHANIYQKLENANIEAKEASRLKSEFLASTSHELRTPLNGILGFLKLVLDNMADNVEEEREFIEQAYNSALHLLNLINDILDIAKIEAGKIDFKLGFICLKEIYHDIYNFAYNQARKKNLSLMINLPKEYDRIFVYADYQRLLQVMLNLVGNALKFTDEGSIEINTEIVITPILLQNQTLPGMVKITVEDSGIGIALDKQERLFETFYQVDGSRTKTYGGTGLGLAISKRLVEGMGGKISFYSMGEGLGSTVTITIPLAKLPVLKTQVIKENE
jgi:signal transduction histidine kinase